MSTSREQLHVNLMFVYFNEGYGLDGWGLNPGKGKSFLHGVQTSSGPTQPPIQWVSGALP
jgi:hypothetical protein